MGRESSDRVERRGGGMRRRRRETGERFADSGGTNETNDCVKKNFGSVIGFSALSDLAPQLKVYLPKNLFLYFRCT